MLGVALFWFENFDARYFFGCKISGLCIFLDLEYEAQSDCRYPPLLSTIVLLYSV